MKRFYRGEQKRVVLVNRTSFQSIVKQILPTGLLSALLIACVSGSAYFVGSNNVSRQFEAGTVLPEHRYYTGGPVNKPNAVVAIHQSYELVSPYWRPITITPASLEELTATVKFVPDAEYKTSPNGARIIANDGRSVGVWYSVFEPPPLKMVSEKQVYIGDPVPRIPMEIRRKTRNRD